MLSRNILAKVMEASRSIHRSGSLSPAALVSLAKHLESRNPKHTVETGTGASTLVFSHISLDHTVFTINTDDSMTAVQRNPLLNSRPIRFVLGPTQRTLPSYVFESKLQAVLLDGPHAYPFPDLEYFYLYPHIDEGGLLVVDDIHIPTLRNLYRFLRKDDMFKLIEVTDKTAFFSRTGHAVFDPWSDGWWLQGFNRHVLSRYAWREKLKSSIPGRWRSALRGYSDRMRLWRW